MKSLERRASVAAYDAIVSGFSFWLAFYARYNFDSLPHPQLAIVYCVAFGVVSLIVFASFGVNKGYWRFASLPDFNVIVLASTTAVVVFTVGCFFITRLAELPRSVPAIAAVTMIFLLAGSRAVFRWFKTGGSGGDGARRRILIIGSTRDAESVIRRFGLENGSNYRVVGIVAFSARSIELSIRGIEVLGDAARLDAVLTRLEQRGNTPDIVLVAAPQKRAELVRSVIATAAQRSIPVVRVTQDAAVPMGDSFESSTKPFRLEDLLNRPPVELEVERISALIKGRTVLITGAGGSIGSEIARQVASFGPRKLVILDHSEFALYMINAQIKAAHPQIELVPVLASVCDRGAMLRVMAEHAPQLVYHVAALKHVPLVERNICEGVRTNVIGTRNVADAAAACGSEAFIMISTDKAVRPTSVMGASKRAAEAYCQALDTLNQRTRFVTVRFGNVLGSSGSVIPLFERQIQAGGPVTVTHPDMTRYFMSIREATELVLQASVFALAEPDRKGAILVLDMGQPIKIADLARTMIAISGKKPDVDIAISFIGIRPGEKLFEELLDPDEPEEAASMDGLILAIPRFNEMETIVAAMQRVEAAVEAGDVKATLHGLKDLVPEFSCSMQQSVAAPEADIGASAAPCFPS